MRRLFNLAITSSLLVGLLLAGVVATLDSPAARASPRGWWDKVPDDWRRVWPSDAPSDICRDGTGYKHLTTGPAAASWINYGGSGSWKVYQVEAGVPLKIITTTNNRAITRLDYDVYDQIDGRWRKVIEVRRGHREDAVLVKDYKPRGSKLKVAASDYGSFYVHIFQERTEPLPGRQAKNLDALIEKLWRVHDGVLDRLTGGSPKVAYISGLEVRDFVFEARMKSKGAHHMNLGWRSPEFGKGYFFGMDPYRSPTEARLGVQTEKRKRLGRKRGISNPISEWGSWHTYKVVADWNRFKMYRDGEKIFDVEDSTFTGKGRLGIGAASRVWIDYILVKDLEGNMIFKEDFEAHRYFLTPGVKPPDGGSITLDPPGGIYDGGTKVTVTAEASEGYEFDYWEGDFPEGEKNNKQITVTMDSDKSLTANFELTTKWSILTVDSGAYAGSYSSIELDFDDCPCISYHYNDAKHSALKYARWTGSSWKKEFVDRGGGADVTVGEFTSLALDSEGRPHISYYDSTHGWLKYAHWDGDSWNIEVVDEEVKDCAGSTIALDLDYHPHISYVDGVKVKYACRDGGSWTIWTVPEAGGCESMIFGVDYPYIVYSTYRRLRLVSLIGNRWEIKTIASINSVCDLSMDGTHIAAGRPGAGGESLEYFHLNIKEDKWEEEIVDPKGCLCPSIVSDFSGDPHIAYEGHEFTGMYAHKTKGSWQIEVVDKGLFDPSIDLDTFGAPCISYQRGMYLMYAHRSSTPEEASSNLAASEPQKAAKALERISPEKGGKIIDAAVEAGISENMADIVVRMNHPEATSMLMESDASSAANLIKSAAQKNVISVAKIVDKGAKENLMRQASILNKVKTETVEKLLVEIYNLPETPETAANLLEAMSLDKSTSVIQIMIGDGKFDYINGMFSRISDEKLNDIYSNLTKEQKDELFPHLSASVKDRIKLEKPMPWTLIAGIILAIAVIAGILAYLRRR